MIIRVRTKTGHELPTYHDGSEFRFLGYRKNRNFRSQFMRFQDANPLIDLKTVQDVNWSPIGPTIMNQGGNGSCVGHSVTQQTQVAMVCGGATYVPLSADSLYAQVNNGIDAGADPGQAIQEGVCVNGICTLADVPDRYIQWGSISPAAKQTALRYRASIAAVYEIHNWAELVSAVALEFSCECTINVGDNFDPDPVTGLVPYTPGYSNHSVFAGCEIVHLPNGKLAIAPWNSWGTEWAMEGKFLITQEHIDGQQGGSHWAMKWMDCDPQDPTNPPLAA